MRRWGMAVVQLGITLVAGWLLWRYGSLSGALSMLGRTQPFYLGLAIGLWALIQGMCVLRWHRVNRLQGLRVPLGATSGAYLVGMFFNTFLPSGFGGDAVRAYKLARYSNAAASSVVSVVIDRYLSLYALVAVSGLAVLVAPDIGRAISLPMLVAALVLGAIPIVAVLALPMAPVRDGVAKLGFLAPLQRAMAAKGAPKDLGGIALLSLTIQVLNAYMHVLLLMALGVRAPVGYVMAVIPLMSLVASLPISVNGLGLREGTLIYFLGQVGVPASQAVALGMLSLGMLLLVGAVGGGLFVFEGLLGRRVAAPAAEAS